MEAALSRGIPFRFKARGFSMTPFIRDGDIVTIRPLAGRDPKAGEVVAVVLPGTGKLLIHRIVSRNGTFFTVKGDNLRESDGTVPGDRILGIAATIERGGKKIVVGSRAERFFFALIRPWGFLIPFLTGIIRSVRSKLRRRKS